MCHHETSRIPGTNNPQMHLGTYRSRKWNILVLSILGLAVAVFAWGLHYKVSLYKSAPVDWHRVASAKLLSNRERPADIVVQVERAITPVIVPTVFCASLVLFTGLLLDPRRRSRWIVQRSLNLQLRPLPQILRPLFFRPPPSL